MRLISVNVGLPQEIEWRGQTVRTSIFKKPVSGQIFAGRLNLEGDGQADLIGHGGEHRALMVYQKEAYNFWKSLLGRDNIVYGQFGENLTVEDLPDNEVCIGDRYRIGTALFEVTQPRVTCYKVGISLGADDLPFLMVKHKRPGFYLRVLIEGYVQAGDTIHKIQPGAEGMTVAQISDLLYLNDHPQELLLRALKIPALSWGWQDSFRKLLQTAIQPDINENDGKAGLSVPKTEWSGFRDFKISKTERITETIRAFELEPKEVSAPISFIPGQYIAALIYVKGENLGLIRSYSLCGSSDNPVLRIAVKKIDNGKVSRHMHEELKIGDTIGISMPRGTFTMDPMQRHIAFFSAGVGVTPFLPMLYKIASSKGPEKIWWVHSCRNSDNEAFRTEIKSLNDQIPNLQRLMIYSSPLEKDILGSDYDLKGRINTEAINDLQLPGDTEIYICGPLGYNDKVTEALSPNVISPSQIHSEQFIPLKETKRNHSDLIAQPNNSPAKNISFLKSNLRIAWEDSFKSILELAENYGIPVNWSCRAGICRRCQTSILSGETSYAIEPLSPLPESQVLICCSRPVTDIVLDL
ncbi:MOSC and FAD-binding oxidoreductase domain-containing protein [Pedobacter miscanthi]|uniref:Sulfurase n=1 Tax=Pedobacter miscanthi TaxID=2259170 RepID=A0A366L2Z2_9SPHI|nr:MOSC and FAD-binding oxidoreductase domain-containing protein [Pedobacter miscanthi]RBQ07849.1 sulfurase [Pedobacter miscanthi]